VLTRSKRDDYHKRHRAFGNWKDSVIKGNLTLMERANTEQVLEVEKLKEAHARTLN
jgi:hypothetical protein